MFLHGKRNRRLDYLIAVLIRDVGPYFAIRYHRNRLGFEGPTLEMRKHQDIETRGKAIPAASVVLVNENLLEVQSQTLATIKYEVTISPMMCNCPDFPLIQLCKHTYAARLHYPTLAWDNNKESKLEFLQTTELVQEQPVYNSPTESATTSSSQLQKTVAEISRLSHSLSIHSLKPCALQRFDVEKLVIVESLLRDVLLDSTLKQPCLPPAEHLPPNKRTKTETAEAYSRKVPPEKTKRKSLHTDPYAGGERSGKKAKCDALIADDSQITTRNTGNTQTATGNFNGRRENKPRPQTLTIANPKSQSNPKLPPSSVQLSSQPAFVQNTQHHFIPAPTMPYYYYPVPYCPQYPVYMTYTTTPSQNSNPPQTQAQPFSDPLLPPLNGTQQESSQQ